MLINLKLKYSIQDAGLSPEDDFLERLLQESELQESEGAGPNFAGPNFTGPNFAGPNFATEATNVNIQTADKNAQMTNVNPQLTNFNVPTIDPNELFMPDFSADIDFYMSLGFSEQDTEMIRSWDI